MKAYKGFNKDMTCRGFQYKEGGEYETERAVVCECGFHACENPIDCLKYYNAGDSVFHEVEVGGDVVKSGDDTKVAATKIKIGARVSIPALCKATFEFVRSKCTNEKNAERGKPATAGYRGAATAGDCGAATAGDSGAATAGYRGAATAGSFGAATAGSFGVATAGDRGAATAGDRGAATAGYSGAATSRGSVKVGENGIGCVRGKDVKAMGGMGAILVIAIENDDGDIKEHRSIMIDGRRYKADKWYTLKAGKVVEVKGKRVHG